MANNGKGVGNGKGLDQAEDNFANGYYEHNSNGAADKGLENALDHNPFSMSTTIDFDSGVNDITYSYYDYYYYYYTAGNYTQDGYTLNWYDYDYYPDYYGYSPAIGDADGDGDNEFGGGSGYYDSTWGTLTQDSGETFSLISIDVENDDGDGYYSYYDYVYVQSYDAATNDYAYSYNYDDGLDTWTTYVYDYDAGYYTTYGAVDSDISAYYQDVSSLDIGSYSYYSYYYGSDGISLDNIEVA